MKIFMKKHPIAFSILAAEGVGLFFMLLFGIGNFTRRQETIYQGFSLVLQGMFLGLLLGFFFLYPVVLTIINVTYLFRRAEDVREVRASKMFEWITFVLGFLFSVIYTRTFSSIQFRADWTKTLSNNQIHTPIDTQTYPTMIVIALAAFAGYLILSFIPVKKMPPLVIVSGMAAMYLGIAESLLWVIQIFGKGESILCLFPVNCILIAVKVIRNKILEWNSVSHEEEKTYRFLWLNRCNHFLRKSQRWPIAALLLMWPLLGILICLLALFGQQPDAVIKAWTETSDWNLSKRVAPQNVFYDEHYLCTVAAGGHRKIVRPIRLGVRHGHEVIVNRQLCVANAFEQILEERVPSLHRNIRHVYDTYGFPVAKCIHSPYVADIIYILMKPLEWLFLVVLYFTDVNPENRIAVQYMRKNLSVAKAHTKEQDEI